MAKIAVIVPVYNAEECLERCINSLLAQTFTDFNVILIDDGSTDGSPDICDKYVKQDRRIAVIHQTNQGVSAARNNGIDYAINSKCEWLAFVDSDDWVSPFFLEILYGNAIKYNVRISCCEFKMVHNYSDTFETKRVAAVIDSVNNLAVKNLIHISFCVDKLYDISLFKDIRFPTGVRFEDEMIVYKILFLCDKIVVENVALYFYFQNPKGFIFSQWTTNKMEEQLFALREQLDFFHIRQYKELFLKRFDRYFLRVQDFIATYCKGTLNRDFIQIERRNVKIILKKNKTWLPVYGREDEYLFAFGKIGTAWQKFCFIFKQKGVAGILQKLFKIKK